MADMLRAASPAAEWGAGGVDRADELAGLLIENGLRDITKIGLRVVETKAFGFGLEYGAPVGEIVRTQRPRTPLDDLQSKPDVFTASGRIQALVFVYDGKDYGYLGAPGKRHDANGEILGTDVNTFHGYEFAWSPEGHGHVGYRAVIDAGSFRLIPVWTSSSDWGEFRSVLKTSVWFFGTIFMAMYGTALTSSIGATILGPSTAAAYPALAQVVGSVAMSTAINGGDVEAGVKNAAYAYLGAQVGDAVRGVTEIDTMGKVAASVTTAALRGGDIEQAAAMTLLRNAGDLVGAFETDNGEIQAMENFDYGVSGDPYAPDIEALPAVMPYDVSTAWLAGPAIGAGSSLTGEIFYDAQPAELTFADAAQYTIGAPSQMQMPIEPPRATPPADPWTLANARDVVNSVSQLALTAIGVTRAFQAARNPQVVPNARNVTQNGTVTTALSTGVVQTRSPDGRSVNQRPPVGVAQSTIDGNVIINNGDGTYTLIDANGGRRIIKYGGDAGSGLSDLPWPLIMGGAGVLFALLK
jgi:hypothetical protein